MKRQLAGAIETHGASGLGYANVLRREVILDWIKRSTGCSPPSPSPSRW